MFTSSPVAELLKTGLGLGDHARFVERTDRRDASGQRTRAHLNDDVDGRNGMPNSVDLFEMRRLEELSNTIFGVAMTLLAYRFPAAQFLNGAPVWSTLWTTYQSQIVALLL